MSGIIAILTANIIWGAAPAIFKYALHDIPPFTLAFIRFFGAALIFLPLALPHVKKLSAYEWKNIVLGAIWGISINIAFFFRGLPLAPSINVHIIGSLGPLVLYGLSLFMLKEKAHPQIIKGMLVSLVGISVIVFAPMLQSASPLAGTPVYSISSLIWGNLFFILSMLGAVLIVVYNKRVSKSVNPYYLTGLQFFIGAITFAPLMMYELQTWSFSSLTQSSWVGIIYGTLFSSALGYFAHNYSLIKMKAQQTGIFSYIMPVISVMVAIPVLGEYPDIYFVIGAILIFIGIFISERHPHLHEMHKRMHAKK